MANPELLAKLKDVHLPPEVSWWPLAVGWWILITIIFLLIIVAIIHQIRKAKKFRISKAAIKELELVQASTDKNWLIQLEVLLKRASLSHFPKQQVAALTQDNWIKFLMQTGDSIWQDQSLTLLKDAVYQDANKVSVDYREQIFSQSKQWLLNLPNEAKNV